jgi:hypothetical protein
MGRKLTITAVVGLLLCTVTLLEFPELINLVDDTTNNFAFLTLPGEIAISPADRIEPEEPESAITGNCEPSMGLQMPEPGSHSPDSLLQWFCIRRT